MSSQSAFSPFTFEIQETLYRRVTVEAECLEEAFDEVYRQYRAADIVLTAEDFLDYEINFLE